MKKRGSDNYGRANIGRVENAGEEKTRNLQSSMEAMHRHPSVDTRPSIVRNPARRLLPPRFSVTEPLGRPGPREVAAREARALGRGATK